MSTDFQNPRASARGAVKEMQKALHDAAENEATERKWREVAPEMWNG